MSLIPFYLHWGEIQSLEDELISLKSNLKSSSFFKESYIEGYKEGFGGGIVSSEPNIRLAAIRKDKPEVKLFKSYDSASKFLGYDPKVGISSVFGGKKHLEMDFTKKNPIKSTTKEYRLFRAKGATTIEQSRLFSPGVIDLTSINLNRIKIYDQYGQNLVKESIKKKMFV